MTTTLYPICKNYHEFHFLYNGFKILFFLLVSSISIIQIWSNNIFWSLWKFFLNFSPFTFRPFFINTENGGSKERERSRLHHTWRTLESNIKPWNSVWHSHFLDISSPLIYQEVSIGHTINSDNFSENSLLISIE